ncbi:MAG: hypothetical protein AB1761_08635 [Pseudomonadota bacterium]
MERFTIPFDDSPATELDEPIGRRVRPGPLNLITVERRGAQEHAHVHPKPGRRAPAATTCRRAR